MFSKFIILALVHLRNQCKADENAEYTYQATAVSEAAEQMTINWNGDKLIGGQQFEVLTMPADVEPATTNQQFIVIDALDPSKSYEFTVFCIKENKKTPIAYTRGQVLPRGSSPTCQGGCDGSPEKTYKVTSQTKGLGKVNLYWTDGYTIRTETERFLIETTPPDVPKIIVDKNSLAIDKLKPNTSYKFMVYLRDKHGILKTPSADTLIQTLPPDDNNPTDLNAEIYRHNRIDLEWKAAKNAARDTFTYTVQCTSHPDITYTTEGTRYPIPNLYPGTYYTFAVHSTKADGTFYPGAPVVGKSTWNEDKNNPSDVIVEFLTPRSIRLSWKAPAETDQTPTLYKIVTNSDKKNAQETELTTIDIQNLSPSKEYVFTVYATPDRVFMLQPGAYVKTKTPDEDAEYTYQATAVSEAAEQMTVNWNGDKLIGGQQFEVLTMPADVELATTNQQFIVIDALDPSKSYEFTVFCIKENIKTPIAYTRGQVLPRGSSPTCQGGCDGSPEKTYKVTSQTEGLGKVNLYWTDGYTIRTEKERFLIVTTPPDVPKIIVDKNVLAIDKLKPNTSYKCMVYLRDEHGILKIPSADTSIQTLPPDDNNPTDLNAVVYSHNRIDLEWKVAKNAAGDTLTNTVQCTSHPDITYTTEGTRYPILNLYPGTYYTFAVHSTKADGTFYPGAPVVGKSTWNEDKNNPSDVTVESLTPRSIRLSWEAPAKTDQTPTLYKIVTNSDEKNAQETELTTMDIQNLSPSTEYVFTVYATPDRVFMLKPGAYVKTKTPDEDAK